MVLFLPWSAVLHGSFTQIGQLGTFLRDAAHIISWWVDIVTLWYILVCWNMTHIHYIALPRFFLEQIQTVDTWICYISKCDLWCSGFRTNFPFTTVTSPILFPSSSMQHGIVFSQRVLIFLPGLRIICRKTNGLCKWDCHSDPWDLHTKGCTLLFGTPALSMQHILNWLCPGGWRGGDILIFHFLFYIFNILLIKRKHLLFNSPGGHLVKFMISAFYFNHFYLIWQGFANAIL